MAAAFQDGILTEASNGGTLNVTAYNSNQQLNNNSNSLLSTLSQLDGIKVHILDTPTFQHTAHLKLTANCAINALATLQNCRNETPMVSTSNETMDSQDVPVFAPAKKTQSTSVDLKGQTRRVLIPGHRMSPLKKDWVNIYGPLVDLLKLQVRMNPQKRAVELRSSKHTQDSGHLQKGADFVKAYALGFAVEDAIALLRLDDLYIDSFEVKDVKSLQGDHLSRAIGRIAGQNGKTKFALENATRTRIVLADTHIHILGAFNNCRLCKDSICSLILGSPPGKVYNHLKVVGARLKQRF
ncbi:hypothetical protein E3P77_00322 [Wallemia ichthyophaga]|nr:hypothetical protein E3P77_00322 [Wallemia ichthyophaga]